MRKSGLLLAPALVVYLGLFVAAAIYFFTMSFWKVKLFKVVPVFNTQNYEKVLAVNTGPFATTLLIAFAIATSATILGFLYAWIIRFKESCQASGVVRAKEMRCMFPRSSRVWQLAHFAITSGSLTGMPSSVALD